MGCVYKSILSVCHKKGSVSHTVTTCMAQVFKAGKPLDEGKEGSLRFIRLREQRTRVHWRPSTLPWATLATRGALEGDALILI